VGNRKNRYLIQHLLDFFVSKKQPFVKDFMLFTFLCACESDEKGPRVQFVTTVLFMFILRHTYTLLPTSTEHHAVVRTNRAESHWNAGKQARNGAKTRTASAIAAIAAKARGTTVYAVATAEQKIKGSRHGAEQFAKAETAVLFARHRTSDPEPGRGLRFCRTRFLR
jgi:hypothetical protein